MRRSREKVVMFTRPPGRFIVVRAGSVGGQFEVIGVRMTHLRADSTSPFIMSPMVACNSSLSRLISSSKTMPVSCYQRVER